MGDGNRRLFNYGDRPVVEQQPATEAVEVIEIAEVVEESGPGFAGDNKTPVDAWATGFAPFCLALIRRLSVRGFRGPEYSCRDSSC